ncbi:MAG: hypothetical protein IT370_10875 [Deltaproteobacteria bacterium]|nr:hypothetical protein [Deltaproteobacteria bacterium]
MAPIRPLLAPYASLYVATYEPLLLSWLSETQLQDLRKHLVQRVILAPPTPVAPADGSPRVALATTTAARLRALGRPVLLRERPGDDDSSPGSASATHESRANFSAGIDNLLTDPTLTIRGLRDGLTQMGLAHLLGDKVELGLSPIGISHLYRQLYFDGGAGLGPVEQVFAIAPGEELEVVQELVRRQTYEREESFGSESTIENEREVKNEEEIADQVQSRVGRDVRVAVSAHGEGSVGVFSGGASGSFDLTMSSEQARELTRRRMMQTTTRSAETLRKTYALRTRSVSDITERSAMRRTLRNASAVPVNYALRRVMRRVDVKLQELGPQLIWQLHLTDPGARLALGQMVVFQDSPAAPDQLPPDAPPAPRPDNETGSATVRVDLDPVSDPVELLTRGATGTIKLVIAGNPLRTYTGITITDLADASPDGDGRAPSLLGTAPVRAPSTPTASEQSVSFTVAISAGSAREVVVQYKVHFEPSQQALTEWRTLVSAANARWHEALRMEQFERARKLVEQRSRIRPRPAADLRDEERYEILSRLIDSAFPRGGARPGPLEIELFHRYFDVSALFYYAHPSWWQPRPGASGRHYEITEESEPARFGSSLGWLLQADGDRRRNEFLNSPFVRVCLPMRAGMERAAIGWLAEHFEGQRGLDLAAASSLGQLLAALDARRLLEGAATPGPDYLTAVGGPAPTPADDAARRPNDARTAFPVVDAFQLLVPTEGLAYQLLEVEGDL